ncbi:MAG TPA: PAS and ANTAR domain-containing protein [Mycobacterium sp.]|nr:PAS and ANTAR domain-containing protein [Mycobacterium sp.]
MAEQVADDLAGSAVEQALVGGDAQRVGWFRFYLADERWEWSPQVQRMHGYEPGEVEPTTEIVLSHKHPDDYRKVAATLDEVRRVSAPFSTRHRIVDKQGRTHHVVVAADRLYDEDGNVIGTHGFYVDVTPLLEKTRQDGVSEAVAEIAQSRAVIEQAKGMLMLVYQIDADTAFELLKWRSQEANVKLRVLAEQIAADFVAQSSGDTLPPRTVFDRLLVTAHERAQR